MQRAVVRSAAAAMMAVCLNVGPSGAESVVGVAKVIDGDTLEVSGTRIRFYGVDAPESKQSCTDRGGKEYPCGVLRALRSLRIHEPSHLQSVEHVDYSNACGLQNACKTRSAVDKERPRRMCVGQDTFGVIAPHFSVRVCIGAQRSCLLPATMMRCWQECTMQCRARFCRGTTEPRWQRTRTLLCQEQGPVQSDGRSVLPQWCRGPERMDGRKRAGCGLHRVLQRLRGCGRCGTQKEGGTFHATRVGLQDPDGVGCTSRRCSRFVITG